MDDLGKAAEAVAQFMRLLTTTGGFRLKFRITAGAGAADPDGFERRDIYVECKGADSELLTENDGEVLRAFEHVAAKMLALESEEHDRVSFDANGFKAERAGALRATAQDAMDEVEDTEQPFHFGPMNSRERRMLHMFLMESGEGMKTASSGEGPRRHVVLYPEGFRIPEERRDSGSSRGRGGFSSDRGRGNDRNRGGNRSRY